MNPGRLPIILNFPFSILLFLLPGCAVVVPPTGGDKDTTAPVVTSATPDSNQVQYTKSEIVLTFNEYISIKNNNGIILSPPPYEKPRASIHGKQLIIKSKSLNPNTTYQLTLQEAIADLNENNLMSDYRLSFSTGNDIDTGVISGKVQDHLTQETLKDITIALIPKQDKYDSIPFPLYITRSNQSGWFAFTNLPYMSSYTMMAFDDINNNYKTENTERFAFISVVTTNDTDEHELSLSLPYFPKRPVITKTQSLNKYQTKLAIKDLPATFDISNNKISSGKEEHILVNQIDIDTIVLFDTYIYENDQRVYYLKANGQIIDTAKLTVNDMRADSLSLKLSLKIPLLEPFDTIKLQFNNPVHQINEEQVSLLQDSLNTPSFKILSDNPFTARIIFNSAELSTYRLIIQPGFVKDVLGQTNKADTLKFSTPDYNQYGSLHLSWFPVSGSFYIIELLKDLTKPADFTFYSNTNQFSTPLLPKGEYHIRITYDTNHNRMFDPVVRLNTQPEQIFVHSKKIQVRPNWEIRENLVD